MVKEISTHTENIHATACCSWQGGGAGQQAKLSLWAEFRPLSWEDIADDTKKNLGVGINHS